MNPIFFKLLGALNVVLFLIINIFFKVDRNRFYLKYIILTLPLLIFFTLPNINGFVFISSAFFLFFHQNNNVSVLDGKFYKGLVISLFLSILIGYCFVEIMPNLESILHLTILIPTFLYTSLIIKETSDDPDFFYEIISCLRFSLILSFIFLFVQMIIGPHFVLTGIVKPNVLINGGVRYPSFLSDPQHYSQFVSVLSFISLIKPKVKKYGYKDFLLIIFSLLAIMSSGGRVGLMGFILGISLLILFSKGYYKFIFIFLGIGLYFILMQFQDKFAIFKRGTDLDDAYAFRHEIWEEAFQMFKKSPFFGIGFDNYSRYVFLHNPNQFWIENNESFPYDVPENGNLKLLTELGGIGFLIIYTLILYPITRVIAIYFKKSDYNILLLFCSILSFILSFNGTYTFADPRIFILILTIISCIISYRTILIKATNYENEEL